MYYPDIKYGVYIFHNDNVPNDAKLSSARMPEDTFDGEITPEYLSRKAPITYASNSPCREISVVTVDWWLGIFRNIQQVFPTYTATVRFRMEKGYNPALRVFLQKMVGNDKAFPRINIYGDNLYTYLDASHEDFYKQRFSLYLLLVRHFTPGMEELNGILEYVPYFRENILPNMGLIYYYREFAYTMFSLYRLRNDKAFLTEYNNLQYYNGVSSWVAPMIEIRWRSDFTEFCKMFDLDFKKIRFGDGSIFRNWKEYDEYMQSRLRSGW
jgi:hypothetical protein